MQYTWKKTALIVAGEVLLAALLLCIGLLFFSRTFQGYFAWNENNYFAYGWKSLHYDKMRLLETDRKYDMYINLKMVENPDGSFMVFSHQCHLDSIAYHISLIKLDKNLHQLWEKLVPGYVEPFPVDAGFTGEKYCLITPDYRGDSEKVFIRTFNPDGSLDKVRELQGDYTGDRCSFQQFILVGKSAFILSQRTKPQNLVLAEVDIASGKLIRESTLPLTEKDLIVSQVKYDSQSKAIYFAGTDRSCVDGREENRGKRVLVWKYDSSGQLAQIIEQKFPDKVSVALCIDDMPYLVVASIKTSANDTHSLRVYAIKDNKLAKLWVYEVEGASQNRMQCIKTGKFWYVSDSYKRGKESYSAIIKFDNAGKYVARTKLIASRYYWFYQLVQTREGRILFTGTINDLLSPGGRPFVSVVKE